MTPDATPDPHDRAHDSAHDATDEAADALAAFALDAVDADEALSIEAWLAADPAADSLEAELRATTGLLAAAAELLAPGPSDGLRDRMLDAALARRPDTGVPAAGPAEIHAIELERFVSLLRDLDAEDWSRPIDPAELAGWTIHDLAAHVSSNETLLAAHVGSPVPGVPETDTLNEARTAATQARFASLPAAEIIAELEVAVEAVDAAVRTLDDEELDQPIDWWGQPSSIRAALLIRAFETWTHADDARRAAGLPHRSPPAPSLLTMSRTAVSWMPIMLSASGVELPHRPVRVHLTGAGGGSYDITLAADQQVHEAGALRPDAEITVDLVAFCRAVANRLPDDGLPYTVVGDQDLARTLVAAVPALAAL